MKRKNMGSTFDSWLREEGIEGEVTANAIRRAAAGMSFAAAATSLPNGPAESAELGAMVPRWNAVAQHPPVPAKMAGGIDEESAGMIGTQRSASGSLSTCSWARPCAGCG